jgi:glycosyltransferase involved in cell wall biosynthesis
MFVRAAGLLKERGIEARYLIVGSPAPGCEDHLEKIRELIAERDLDDHVIFTGELEDTRPAYAAMELFVLPSAQPEPFGGVVMEAMAMGVPVVATNIGGSPDQVAEGETGLLVPPKDPEALADAIQQLIESPDLRARMSSAGPERIKTHFALSDKIARLQQVYRELLQTH